MIKRDHPELSISQQCKLVRLSRSAFYYTPVGVNADTLAMMKEIDRVFTRYPFFGSRQIAAYLRREGIVIGRHRVRRLMAKMGLEAIYKRPRTSKPHPQHPVYPYLLRKRQIDRPNQVWGADITFVPVKNGFAEICTKDWLVWYETTFTAHRMNRRDARQIAISLRLRQCLVCSHDKISRWR
jgi:putative transposase